MTEQERSQKARECLRAAKLLCRRALVNAYEGNVSVRLEGSILITPSAVCKEELEEDDLVEVDLASGKTLHAKEGRVPSSETKMHLCVYRHSGAQAVVHGHPPLSLIHICGSNTPSPARTGAGATNFPAGRCPSFAYRARTARANWNRSACASAP